MVYLIIIVIILLLFVGYFAFLNNTANELIIDQTCWNDVALHSKLVGATKAEVTPDIKCPTHQETIKKSDSDEEASQKIATAWARCWANWHRGQAVLFNDTGTYCHVCHIFTFENREQLEGLYTYMRTHNVPGTEMNYLNYLTPFSTQETGYVEYFPTELSEDQKKEVGETLDLENDKYAIIFLYAKGQSNIDELMQGNRLELLLGGTGLAFIGVSTALYGIAGISTALTAAATTGAAMSWNPVGWAILGATAVAAAGTIIYAAIEAGEPPQWMAVTFFVPYNPDTIEALGCKVAPADVG